MPCIPTCLRVAIAISPALPELELEFQTTPGAAIISPVVLVISIFPPLPAVELELRLLASIVLLALSAIGPPFPVVDVVSIAPAVVSILPLLLVRAIARPGFLILPTVRLPVVLIEKSIGFLTSKELIVVRERKGTVFPMKPLALITPVPAVKTRLPSPSTVPPKLMSPAFVNPVSRVTLEPVPRETCLPKVIFCSLVRIFAFKLVVRALKVIEALFAPVMFPLTAIVPACIVMGKLKVTPAGSIAIAPVPSVRPITIWENPFNVSSSVWIRFKGGTSGLF